MKRKKKFIIWTIAMAILMMSSAGLRDVQAEWVAEHPVQPGLRIAEGTSWTTRPSAWITGYRPFDMGFRFTVRSNVDYGLGTGVWQQGNISIPWGFYDFLEPTMIPWTTQSLRNWETVVEQLPETASNLFTWRMVASGEVNFVGLNLVNVSGRGEVDLNWASARTEVGLYVQGTLRNRFMLHPDDDVVFLFEPQWGMGPIINNYDRNILKVLVNGSLVMDERLGDSAEENFELRTLGVMSMAIPPLVTQSDDIRIPLGTTVATLPWTTGVAGTWGYTTANVIDNVNNNGVIIDLALLDIVSGVRTDSRLSSNGITYNRVGVAEHMYELRDTHSLSAAFPYDNTLVRTSRKISVATPIAPELHIVYDSTAIQENGMPMPTWSPYQSTLDSPVAQNICGGEDGWTNQPLDIVIIDAGIPGSEFQTVIQIPAHGTEEIGTYEGAHVDYWSETPLPEGHIVAKGMLTEIGNLTNVLSGISERTIKMDKTPPIAHAIYEDREFKDASEDALSGLAERTPSRIAFVPVALGTAQPAEEAYVTFDAISDEILGEHYVWIWARDKAGNTTKTMLPEPIDILDKGASILKDTDKGATLHTKNCVNHDKDVLADGCEEGCIEGEQIGIEESTQFTYQLTLKNEEPEKTTQGSFTDYLPEGVIVLEEPTFTPGQLISNLQWELEESGPYAGRYKVSGNYQINTEDIIIEILCETPVYAEGESNIISNQATLTWSNGLGESLREGEKVSNFANHQVTEQPGVITKFTKVGADALDAGQAGAHFVLYKWSEEEEPTEEEKKQIVDASALSDGNWTRVKFEGEEATTLEDVFVSSALGEVDFGKLPKGIYTLIETKAPTGYELPVGQWILSIAPEKENAGVDDYQIEFVGKSEFLMPPAAIREMVDGEITYKIINARAFSIGMSGLSGTRQMLLVGFSIMALVGNRYIVFSHKQRRMGQ